MPRAPKKSPNEQVAAALGQVLDDRAALYAPTPGRRHVQAQLTDELMAVVRQFMPDGLPSGSDFDTLMAVNKLTRALELAWHGGYHVDNTTDFGGYTACLAALCLSELTGAEVAPSEVLP